ncbi:MAG: helix-turn-helix transcriptional regulator [Oscillospiraceae bacterium]|nr:helix-turn-helix transcriptional regulator [Oscillospiraceae bacterium]
MTYDAALTLLRNIGKKFHLQITTVTPGENREQPVDLGLRSFLGLDERYDQLFRDTLIQCADKTICRLTDEFFCSYLFLILPDTPRHTALVVGPYITFEMSHEQFIAESDRFGVPPWMYKRMEDYYLNIPVIQDATMLLNFFTAFGETIWDEFQIVDMDHTVPLPSFRTLSIPEDNSRRNLVMDMQIMQARYDSENELMRIVSRGQMLRAERLLAGFVSGNFVQRAADPVRNIKNYCIIGNTLLRKAAEQGGVHPVYLDEMSSDFAKRIESISALSAGEGLFADMVRSYCQLVRKHTAQHYSPLVERAVLFIDTDLSQDLSLRTVAENLNISAGYLSTMFRQETGKTITDYVSEKRVSYAADLLRGSALQVQTIAQYCGIPDVNYFSKIFKRCYGVTPREYRKEGKKTTSPV